MPLHRRLPKRGFNNKFRVEFSEVNLDQLDKLPLTEIGLKEMVEYRLIHSEGERVKVLARGRLSSAKPYRLRLSLNQRLKRLKKAVEKRSLSGRNNVRKYPQHLQHS